MKRLHILDFEKLRDAHPCLAGIRYPKDRLIDWICDACRQGIICEDRDGLFLDEAQVEYWKQCNAQIDFG